MSTPARDFQGTAEAALSNADAVLARWLPGGKYTGTEYQALNPTRSDRRAGSFSINTATGAWADFATDDKGGDLVSLIAYLDGVSQSDAETRLAEFLGRRSTQNPRDMRDARDASPEAAKTNGERQTAAVTRAPRRERDARDGPAEPCADFRHPKHGEPAAVWTYHDQAGAPLFHVCRFGTPDGKVILPRSWDGAVWRWKGIPAPRPLYNLHHLAAKPGAPVLLTEGEKAADAAETMFPDHVSTTTPNGASAAKKADLSPLANRDLYIWPDNDDEGREYAETVARLALEAGAAGVKVLDVDALDLPAKADAADVSLTPEQAAALAWRDADEKDKPRFTVDGKGVHFHGTDKNGEALAPAWICSPLHITAATRDADGNAWGRLLEFQDQDRRPHRWAMPLELLAGDGNEYRRELLRQGLQIAPSQQARQRVGEYIQTTRTTARARCVEKTGWHAGAFVLPDKTLGETGEKVLLQSLHEPAAMRCAGSLDNWRENVAALCTGNSRLVFAVSAAFAAPLLDLTGDDSGGVNFQGPSSTGKTTALHAARSVWGGPDYLQRWRATTNGLEATATAHNDALLCLDELAQVDAREAGGVAYMLANGAGKQRARRDGLAKPKATWRLLFLSAGEIGLAQHMREAGKKARAGQEVRLADVPAVVAHGMFENLHGYPNGGAFADAIRDATRLHYGTPVREYLSRLVTMDAERLRERLRRLRADFSREYLPENADGQARRVCDRFALIAAGGELATGLELTGWARGAATAAAGKCFEAWIDHRGGAGAREERAALEQVIRFFELHGESRFTPLDNDDDHRVTYNRAGFRRTSTSGGAEFFVLPEAWKAEVCDGIDPTFTARLCVERGLIKPDSEGRAVSTHRLGEMGRRRCYHFVRVDHDAD